MEGIRRSGSDHDRSLDQVQRHTRYVAPKAKGIRETYNLKLPYIEGLEVSNLMYEEKVTLVFEVVFRFNLFREL